jgi:hypothetical protein
MKALLILGLTFLTLSAQASVNPMECFERVWIVGAKNPQASTASLAQAAQAIQRSFPVLKLGSSDSPYFFLVSYSAQKSVAQDKQSLEAAFSFLTSRGFYVECNQIHTDIRPFPGMIGINR